MVKCFSRSSKKFPFDGETFYLNGKTFPAKVKSFPSLAKIFPAIVKPFPSLVKCFPAIGNRGDFLAIIQRRQPDAHLVNLFSKHWNHLDSDEFKLRPFRIDIQKETPNLDTLTDIVPFVRSDHSRFWIVNETDFSSLPAILVTDTGTYTNSV